MRIWPEARLEQDNVRLSPGSHTTSVATAVTARTTAVIDGADLPTTLGLLCARLEETADVTSTAGFARVDDGDEWALVGHGTLPPELRGLTGHAAVPAGSLMDQAATSGEPAACHDFDDAGPELRHRHRRSLDAGLRAILCVPVLGSRGDVVGVLGLASDRPRRWDDDTVALVSAFADLAGLVLDRHRADARARTEEARARALSHRLASVLDAVPTPTFELDQTGRIVRWNRAATLVVGWHRAHAVGRPLTALGDGWDGLDAMVTAARRGVAGTTQVEVTGRDGAPLVLEVRVNPLIDDSGAAGVIGTLTDLTDRLAMETAIRRSQRMEALGHFAGGIAHDFGNILSAIAGFADLMELQLPDDATGPRRDATQIREVAERGRRLTDRLLDFAHSRTSEAMEVDVAAGVRELERILARSLDDSCELVLDVDDVPAVVLGSGQLDQLLLNLVSNAGDAMPDGGRVTVRVHHARGRVVLEVEDQGIGIPAPQVDRVFEPFFTTKGTQGGTGLGLANVYAIVRGAGGHTEITSQLGVGTNVRIELPANAAPAGETDPGRAQRVLVVDPETVSRQVLHTALAGAGYRVMAVGAAHEVDLGDVTRTDPVDAVVCPGTAGTPADRPLATLLSRVRQLLPSVTLVELGEHDDRAREPGVTRIPRPYLVDQVVAAVDRAVAGQAAGS